MVLNFIRLNDIKDYKQLILLPLCSLHTSYGQEYIKGLISKYSDKVVAFDTDSEANQTNILFKGVIKYFLFHFELNRRWIYRIKDDEMRGVAFEEMMIVDNEEFDKFKKVLLVNNLNRQ